MPVEVYFSPSDNTTSKIKAAIDQAESELAFGIMVFTENSLGNAIVAAHENGVETQGIIDYVEYTGSEYQYLKDQGVNVRDYVNPDGSQWPDGPVFHHKYALMDFAAGSVNPVVVTGSHNWSASAESINDENTLIIHDANLANQFYQEFQQRFHDQMTPIAMDDDTTTLAYEWINIDYLANDFIPEDVEVMTELVQLPAHGEAELIQEDMSYRSDNDFSGTDSLSYRLYNINNPLLADTSWVRIVVNINSIEEWYSDNFTLRQTYIEQGQLRLQLHATQAEDLRCRLVDISGRIVLDENIRISPGYSSLQLPFKGIARGVLILDIRGNSGRISTSLIY
jgi:hypothetical protein